MTNKQKQIENDDEYEDAPGRDGARYIRFEVGQKLKGILVSFEMKKETTKRGK